jgi:hypothetical protein
MAVNVVQSALSSRRLNRWLFGLAAAVFAAGIIAFIVTRVGGSSNSSPAENVNPTGPAIHESTAVQKNIRFPTAAWKVVKQFVFTALPRKNLARSYQLADASMRGGFSLAQWKTGNIPVTYYPTAKVIRYNWRNTNFAHPREAALNLILVPPKNSTTRPGAYIIFVKKFGYGAKARWKVDYFGPVQGPPVPHP